MELRENIKGYHVNDKKRCLKFISDTSYLITSKDKYWLGYGMYFWDNKSNANYWLSEKKRKKPKEEYVKTVSNIYIDEEMLLDLTDKSCLETLNNLWKLYCKKIDENIKQPLGVKIDKLFNFFDYLNDNIKVVKGIGDYDIELKKRNYFINVSNSSGPQIKENLKTIYCVRSSTMVVNRKIEEDI